MKKKLFSNNSLSYLSYISMLGKIEASTRKDIPMAAAPYHDS
jgi:hypothetical protein